MSLPLSDFGKLLPSVQPRHALDWLTQHQLPSIEHAEADDLRVAQYLCCLVACMESTGVKALDSVWFVIRRRGVPMEKTCSPWYAVAQRIQAASEAYWKQWRGADDNNLAPCLGVIDHLFTHAKCLMQMETQTLVECIRALRDLRVKLRAAVAWQSLKSEAGMIPSTPHVVAKAKAIQRVLETTTTLGIEWPCMLKVLEADACRKDGLYKRAAVLYREAMFQWEWTPTDTAAAFVNTMNSKKPVYLDRPQFDTHVVVSPHAKKAVAEADELANVVGVSPLLTIEFR